VATWLVIVLVVLAVLVLGLFTLGLLGTISRGRSEEEEFRRKLEQANQALAAARALDRGWERQNLEAAARTAHERRKPGANVRELHLVQVVDRPGIEEDQARFRVVDDHGEHDILLGRSGEEWVEVPA
jgi:Flp pilus assembly protein TadB